MQIYRKTGLTTKILLLIAILGLGVWYVSDLYQTRYLSEIFQAKLSERLSVQSRKHRTLFDRHVKSYSQMAKLLAVTTNLHRYIDSETWRQRDSTQLRTYSDTPKWLPDHSVMRKFILPRFAMLLGPDNKPYEIYNWFGEEPPEQFIRVPSYILQLARNQSYLTTLGKQPFLITAEPISDEQGRLQATLVLASPIDSEFLRESQSLSSSSGDVALLSEDQETILVSSDPRMIPSGVKLSQLEQIYQVIGEGFFDYGSTDLVIRFVSFVTVEEVRELTAAVLQREYTSRLFTTAAYAGTFILIMLYLTRRLNKLTNRVKRFSRHMSIQQPDISIKDEVIQLEERFQLLASAIKSETAALEHQASHDPLTELPNRKKLNERLQSALLKSQRNHKPLVLFVSDLNNFKEINDTLGHHIGDEILQQAAERLYHAVRRSDTVARLGGDEFSILLPNTSTEQAMRVAEEIVNIFSQPFVVEGHTLQVGISIGIVESPLHGDDVNILMQRADVAMYTAKRNNRGFAIYSPEDDQHNVSRLELMSELRAAIEEENLEIHYQSKIDLDTGEIIGAEALLRWNHPERGYIQPDDFIPLAEQTGLIRPLSYWVIKQALKDCSSWHRQGHDISVSINISVQCLYDEQLTINLRNTIREQDIDPAKCVLELTESDIMTDPIRAKHILNEIKSIGASISIDDFGTGYSSLAYLKQLPVAEIKIDRSFVMEMLADDNDRIIVQTIIDLAHNLGLKVVAEGITSAAALSVLRSHGCNIGQGFYISMPLPLNRFREYLLSHQETEASIQ
ncbi:MAG: EAL domain-containing protein [Gammaproteobacteria bacterium]|nr:EAL domain-containing protein [Gammaproteobacteria bacterium]